MDRVLTKLEPYPKGKGRISVFLNDEFAFVLYKGELSQYGLEEGMTVSDELYERILNETVSKRAGKRAMNLLMKTDRTEADIRRKLSEGGYPRESVDAAVEYLRSFHYIDDMRYAGEYIRFKSSSMSRRQITMKLREKGVSADVIENAFAAYEEESGCDAAEAENELIQKLIRKRCPEGIENLDHEGKQKLLAYLYNKGFDVSSLRSLGI